MPATPLCPRVVSVAIHIGEELFQEHTAVRQLRTVVCSAGSLSACCQCRAAQSKVMQGTLVAEEPKKRKQARLSWYHPDDTV